MGPKDGNRKHKDMQEDVVGCSAVSSGCGRTHQAEEQQHSTVDSRARD